MQLLLVGYKIALLCPIKPSRSKGRAMSTPQDQSASAQTDEELRRRDRRYRSLVLSLSGTVWMTGPHGELLSFLHTWTGLTGQTAEQAAGEGWLDALHPDDRGPTSARWKEALALQQPYEAAFRVRHTSGDWRYLLARGNPVLGDDGKSLEWVGVVFDLTEQKQAEEALRTRNLRLDRLQAALCLLIRMDNSGDLADILPQITEVLAATLEVERVSIWRCTDDFSAIRCDDLYEKSQRRHSAGSELNRRDYPAYFAALANCATIVADGIGAKLDVPVFLFGKLAGVLCHEHVGPARSWLPEEKTFSTAAANLVALVLEQAERKRIETERARTLQELHESQELFDHFMRHSPAIAFIKSADDRLLYVNKAFEEQIWDGRPPDWRNRTSAELWPAAMARQIRENDLRVLNSGCAEVVEEVVIKPHATETWLSVKFPLRRAAEETCLAGMAVNITQQKRAQEERRVLEARMLHAQKLESLGVLAGGIAHDFNNLLTSMLGYATLAKSNLPADSQVVPMLTEIEGAALRAADLSQQMLTYSGKGKFIVQKLCLGEVIRDMTKLLEAAVAKKARLRFDLAPGTIEGDAAQIRQLVLNLIANASEALEDQGGIISVRTGVRHSPAPFRASPHALPSPPGKEGWAKGVRGENDVETYRHSPFMSNEMPTGVCAFIEVEDSGCGMDQETLTRIFDPFFTTKFTGRGLGLAAALGIVNGHHGKINVVSTPGRGTTMQILFPYVEAIAAPPPAPSESRPTPQSGTILVIDDEETVRRFARFVLESAGFEVLDAVDGRQGLDLFSQRRDIAAILLDLTMPIMDGVETLSELRRLDSTLPVVVMSGYSTADAAARCDGAGASSFIQKPFPPRELVARFREVLARPLASGPHS